MTELPDPDALAHELRDARAMTLALVADLQGEQWIGPQMEIVNPPLWEIGHVAWFQERWILRHLCGQPPAIPCEDGFYDSAGVHHPERWEVLLPRVDKTLAFMAEVQERVLEVLATRPMDEDLAYFTRLAIFHEDMHVEALLYTRQTLGYPPPQLPYRTDRATPPAGAPCRGDAEFAGGTFELGAAPGSGFVFDNEKWAHPVEIPAFALARAPVTETGFLAFVEDGGYRRPELWCQKGWDWRQREAAEHPAYWRKQGPGRWQRRWFDRFVDLSAERPVSHVNWFEADAFCRWAGRRLPLEAEWERAACGPVARAADKPLFPWGDQPPDRDRANLDLHWLDCAPVSAFPSGDSAEGCRQLLGNLWEWTASPFEPYPGFVEDPYRDYSRPWFGSRMVLRGGSFASRGRMLRNTWRNYFEPHRRDLFAGFRTAAE